jgi:hypothetical protein
VSPGENHPDRNDLAWMQMIEQYLDEVTYEDLIRVLEDEEWIDRE